MRALLLITILVSVWVIVQAVDAPVAVAEVPEIPASAKVRPNPVGRTPTSIAHGRQLFASQCSMCHGKTGDGSGALASQLAMTVPDFSDREWQKQRTDGALFYVITHGHGRMPADGERLPEDWRWDMVNAIRTLANQGG